MLSILLIEDDNVFRGIFEAWLRHLPSIINTS
jgi:hypothetical protein